MHQRPFGQTTCTPDISNLILIVKIEARTLRDVMQMPLLHHIQKPLLKGLQMALGIDDGSWHQRRHQRRLQCLGINRRNDLAQQFRCRRQTFLRRRKSASLITQLAALITITHQHTRKYRCMAIKCRPVIHRLIATGLNECRQLPTLLTRKTIKPHQLRPSRRRISASNSSIDLRGSPARSALIQKSSRAPFRLRSVSAETL